MATKRKNTMKKSQIVFLCTTVVPIFLLFLVFNLYPMGMSVYNSFHKWSGYSDKIFIGATNYLRTFKDPIFLKAIINDFIIILGKEILIVGMALFFAIALTKFRMNKKEIGFFRLVFYFPNILSVIIISILWSFIFHPTMGLINGFLEILSLETLQKAWLGDPSTVIPSIIVVASWAGIGFFMVMLIAAINDIPASLYESSQIDGANQWQQTLYITIPRIFSHLKVIIVTIIFQSLVSNFILVMPITNGGPNNASMVMGLYIYQKGFQYNMVGFANAAAIILLIINVVLSLTVNKALEKDLDE